MVAQLNAELCDGPAGNDEAASRIIVTDISDSDLGGVSDSPGHAGFDRGYRVAVTETIASLLPATEAFLRQNQSTSLEVRETLYRFERWLACRLDAASRPEHWVEHGAGI